MRGLAVVLVLVACESTSTPGAPPAPRAELLKQAEAKVGPIEVAKGPVPADAQMMCSADYKVYPRSQIHVVPTWQPDLGRYVGSYRCDAHWKQAIAETRARFAATPTDDEGFAILQVFLERGVTEEQLRVFVAGKPLRDAIAATLSALEAGKLVLEP